MLSHTLVVVSALASLLPTSVMAQCKTFSQVGDSYNGNSKTYITSLGIVCTKDGGHYGPCPGSLSGSGCPLVPTAEGSVEVQGYTNITDPNLNLDMGHIFSLVNKHRLQGNQIQQKDHACLTNGGYGGSATFCLKDGSSGYTYATPTMLCYKGTLEDCPKDQKLKSGTGIEVCGPAGVPAFGYGDGLTVGFQNTTAAVAKGIVPSSDIKKSKCGLSGAGALKLSSSMLALVVASISWVVL